MALLGSEGVVAVVRNGMVPPGIAYELGIARGRAIPAIILEIVGSEDSPSEMPPALRGIQLVRWDPSTRARFSLLSRLHALLAAEATVPPPQRPRPVTGTHREYTSVVERFAADVLRSVGANVVTEGPANTKFRPDLSAWFPDLPNWANPVIIEVKGRESIGRSVESAVEQLRTYLKDLGLVIGLVLIPGESGPTWSAARDTAIASIGIDTMADLGPRGVREALIHGRNLLTHGALWSIIKKACAA